MRATTTLEKEIACFDANRAELFTEHRGEYVLIRGDDIIGFFDSAVDAIADGYHRFEGAPFLVRACADVQAPLQFTTLNA